MARQQQLLRGTSSRRAKEAAGDCNCCSGILSLIAGCLTIVILLQDPTPLVNAYAMLPVQMCVNGTQTRGDVKRFVSCNRWSQSTQNFAVRINTMRAAQIASRDGKIVSNINWDQLNTENTCSPQSNLASSYGMPMGLCDSNGQFNLDVNPYLPATNALICATAFLYANFLFSFLAASCIPSSRRRATGSFLLTLGAIIATAFALGWWSNLQMVKRYLDYEEENVAPVQNVTIYYMGLFRDNVGTIKSWYDINNTDTDVYVPTPILRGVTWGQAYGFFVVSLVLQLIELLMSLSYMWQSDRTASRRHLILFQSRQQQPGPANPVMGTTSGIPLYNTTSMPTTIPTAVPVGEYTTTDNPSISGNKGQPDLRPSRPPPPPGSVVGPNNGTYSMTMV